MLKCFSIESWYVWNFLPFDAFSFMHNKSWRRASFYMHLMSYFGLWKFMYWKDYFKNRNKAESKQRVLITSMLLLKGDATFFWVRLKLSNKHFFLLPRHIFSIFFQWFCLLIFFLWWCVETFFIFFRHRYHKENFTFRLMF